MQIVLNKLLTVTANNYLTLDAFIYLVNVGVMGGVDFL